MKRTGMCPSNIGDIVRHPEPIRNACGDMVNGFGVGVVIDTRPDKWHEEPEFLVETRAGEIWFNGECLELLTEEAAQ